MVLQDEHSIWGALNEWREVDEPMIAGDDCARCYLRIQLSKLQTKFVKKVIILDAILQSRPHLNRKVDDQLMSYMVSSDSRQNIAPLHGYAWIRPGPCAVCMRTGKVIRYAKKGSGKGCQRASAIDPTSRRREVGSIALARFRTPFSADSRIGELCLCACTQRKALAESRHIHAIVWYLAS